MLRPIHRDTGKVKELAEYTAEEQRGFVLGLTGQAGDIEVTAARGYPQDMAALRQGLKFAKAQAMHVEVSTLEMAIENAQIAAAERKALLSSVA